ncbi:MAG: type II toxin-antitoxin system VapC family toxin [Cryobacterium sp.]|nr:type II toxin-antitoxin system VapC family toxin [Cryobacterium sp.]
MARIVVDTSALTSILLGEPDAEQFEKALAESSGDALISAANLLEAMMVIESRNPATGIQDLRDVMSVFGIGVETVTSDIAELSFYAWKRFGRGRHPAALNFGDCFAYALSKQLNAPLLFKGKDFNQTDVASVLN